MDQELTPVIDCAEWFRRAFPGLAVEIPHGFVALAQVRRYAEGTYLCRPDRPVEALTVVVSGAVRLSKNGHMIRDFAPGDYFGEGGLIRDAAPGVDLIALGETTVVEFPRLAARRALSDHPAFGFAFVNVLLSESMARLQATNTLFADNRSLAQQLEQAVAQLALAIEQAHASEEQMRFLATHDPLTRLGNRTLLHQRLSEGLERARRSGRRFALHIVDLDQFKEINDLHGHVVGDRLLVAERVARATRGVDAVARLGGDEFAVVQDLSEDSEGELISANVATLSERMLTALKQPFEVDDITLDIGASIGIALFPNDGDTVEELLRNADLALHRAKQEGRGRVAFFTAALGESALRASTIKANLRQAVHERQFVVHYQPKADLRSGDITGAEALVRWLHPQQGMISPAEFVPIAERSGAVAHIGEFVLRDACLAASRWRVIGVPDFSISVNLSPAQFRLHDVVAVVEEALREADLPPEALELEVTETALMTEGDGAIRQIRRLQDLGVKIAVDDFGTGYSSLAYLRQLAARTLKIDRSFVRGCAVVPEDEQIVQTIVGLAHNLGMHVVAEGVEEPEQIATLQRMRCDAVQGYLIARPMSETALESFLQNNTYTQQRVAVRFPAL
ncbi:MAG: EAL domain-containing protein [Alphaproteobacteria bacterium]|nr:EAL domain-containing protein [Alphaproteobacteria bacterium]